MFKNTIICLSVYFIASPLACRQFALCVQISVQLSPASCHVLLAVTLAELTTEDVTSLLALFHLGFTKHKSIFRIGTVKMVNKKVIWLFLLSGLHRNETDLVREWSWILCWWIIC